MNKPIRHNCRSSCMLLFAAAAAEQHATCSTSRRAASTPRGPGTTSGVARRGVLPQPGAIGRRRAGRRERQGQGRVQVPAGLSAAPQVTPHLTGYFSLHLRAPAVESTQNGSCRAATPPLLVNRVVDLVANKPAQGRLRLAHHRPRGAEGRVRRAAALGKNTRAPSSRSTRATGAVLAMATQPDLRPRPAGQPRLRRVQRPGTR